MLQVGLFGEEAPSQWVIFHDESECKQERFLYHGFLFVRRSEERRILSQLLQPPPNYPNNYSKRVHFTDLRGLQGIRARAAVRWVELARDTWLPDGSVRFYCFGVNLQNINYDLYRDSQAYAPGVPTKKERVYRRFYEIGLKASLAWFQVEPADVTHVYYDQGKQDIDRFNKTLTVCGPHTQVWPLANDCEVSGTDFSKYLQLTDVLLGTVRKTFSGVSEGAAAQLASVDKLYEVVTWFSDSGTSYNRNSPYWRKFCLSFFPRRGGITAEEFFKRDLEYYRKSKEQFYCDRKTFRQRQEEEAQLELFAS